MKNNYIKEAWLVIVLAVGFGVALAGVQNSLQPLVDRNKTNDTYGRVPSLVNAGQAARQAGKTADTAKTRQFLAPDGQIVYKAFSSDGEHLGWVIRAAGQGFADRIELLLGLSADGRTLTGLYVLEQKETPGVGNKIESEAFRGQFVGKSADQPLICARGQSGGSKIVPITGATVSSQSVVGIVNSAVRKFQDDLPRLKSKD